MSESGQSGRRSLGGCCSSLVSRSSLVVVLEYSKRFTVRSSRPYLAVGETFKTTVKYRGTGTQRLLMATNIRFYNEWLMFSDIERQ